MVPTDPSPSLAPRNLDLADLHAVADRAAQVGADARADAAQARARTRAVVREAYDHAHQVATATAARARTYADRLGAVAEDYVGAKIKRRVKPPIVVALVVAGAALVVALVAVATRRR